MRTQTFIGVWGNSVGSQLMLARGRMPGQLGRIERDHLRSSVIHTSSTIFPLHFRGLLFLNQKRRLLLS
ncbi:hypothetical protein RB195_010119 [Necator americanus]|uniref:Uncharacterized protein n=1 Tax=Necator americanus TaxID=51031 RepID=A0ABR1CXW6_NECAM